MNITITLNFELITLSFEPVTLTLNFECIHCQVFDFIIIKNIKIDLLFYEIQKTNNTFALP
jgi:hypothetical protein